MSSLSNALAIDSFYNKPKPNFDLLRALVKEVYQPMTKLELDRFCELRSLFAALRIFPKAYLTCPNSASDAQKTDLVLLQNDQALNIQVKAAKKKKSTTAGLKVLERVKDLDLSALIQKLKSLINP